MLPRVIDCYAFLCKQFLEKDSSFSVYIQSIQHKNGNSNEKTELGHGELKSLKKFLFPSPPNEITAKKVLTKTLAKL